MTPVRREGGREMTEPDAVTEHRFTCPYCWEEISMVFDLSTPEQSYVEDCEVCCNPIVLRFKSRNGMVVYLDARQIA